MKNLGDELIDVSGEIRQVTLDDAKSLNSFLKALPYNNIRFTLENYDSTRERTVEDDKDFIFRQNNNGFMGGVFLGQELIALSTLTYFNDFEMFDSICEIGISVNDSYQRKNIGSTLLEFMKHIAKGDGKKRIDLNVQESNIKAINFYLKNGFKKQATKDAGGFDQKVIFMSIYI